MAGETKEIVLEWSHRREPGSDDDRDVYIFEGPFRRLTMITDEDGEDWLEIDADVRDAAIIEAVLRAYELGRADGRASKSRKTSQILESVADTSI